jgi:hypothetical protein
MNTPLKKAALLLASSTIMLGAASALADSLNVIPLLGTDTSNEGRAITPDGLYVVGLSGAAGGFFYNVANNTVVQPNGGGAIPDRAVTGIGYRTDPVTLQRQVVLDGFSSGYQADWMTTDGGATWGAKRRNTTFTGANSLPVANSLGTSTANANGAFYAICRNAVANGSVYLNQGSGTWTASTAPTITYSSKGISGSDTAAFNGVSATGRAVGFRKNATAGIQNYIGDWNGTGTPTMTVFAGLAANNVGTAFSVAADGNTIFGNSPIVVGGTANWGYVAKFSGTTETSISRLPYFGTETGSTTLQAPYGCTADGFFAVGMDYQGVEKAVLWSVKPDCSYMIDLTQYALDNALLSGWTRLSRAYSAGETYDGFGNEYAVITGVGIYGGVSRAFVMAVMIPEPGTLSLLALGGLALLIHRRRK